MSSLIDLPPITKWASTKDGKQWVLDIMLIEDLQYAKSEPELDEVDIEMETSILGRKIKCLNSMVL